MGCGTGVLSIVASKISKARITSIDNDITAVETTKHNFLKNHVIPKSKVFKSTSNAFSVGKAIMLKVFTFTPCFTNKLFTLIMVSLVVFLKKISYFVSNGF